MTVGGRASIIAADEWLRHGLIVPACLLGVMLCSLHGYTLGVMIQPLEQEFGWSRAAISAATLGPSLLAIMLSPFAGMAIDRFGPRRVALLGVPAFCIAIAMLSLTTANILSWWALYALVGLAMIPVAPTVWTAAINIRFDRNRGLALAITLTGTGVGAAVIPITATLLLKAFGWRMAYVGIGTMFFLLIFPLVYLLFDRDGRHSVAGTRRPRAPRAAFTSHPYLFLGAAVLIFTIANCMMNINSVPILMSRGFGAVAAAEIAGLIGIGTIAGRLLGGVLLDRFDGRFVAAFSGLAPITGSMLLLFTEHAQWAAMLACLFFGISGGTEYDACAYLTVRHFGMKNFGALFGGIVGLSLCGASAAPILASFIYDRTRSYELVLWGMLPAFVMAGILFIAMGRYPLLEDPE